MCNEFFSWRERKSKKERKIGRQKQSNREKKKENSRKSVTWSAVPDAPKLVYNLGNKFIASLKASYLLYK